MHSRSCMTALFTDARGACVCKNCQFYMQHCATFCISVMRRKSYREQSCFMGIVSESRITVSQHMLARQPHVMVES